jgi:hypothetical protein
VEASDRGWAVLAFSVPMVLWVIASLIGPQVTGASGFGWLLEVFGPYVAWGWTTWLRNNLFEVLALTLLALIAWRVYRDPHHE